MALVIIGGVVLDIQAKVHDTELLRGSSVPGKAAQVAGGVGRNIAEAAHHLLQSNPQQQLSAARAVHVISILGRDPAADALLATFKHLGMDASGIMQSSRCSTASVVTVLDRSGEVAASIADVAAAALMTPAVVQQHTSALQQAQLLVVDANFDAHTLKEAAQIAHKAGVPVLFEPVSVPKSVRCTSVLPLLTYITPNANELLAIATEVQQQAGLPAWPQPMSVQEGKHTPQQLLANLVPAATAVLQQGLHYIILTMGSQGAALLSLQPTQSPHRQEPSPLQGNHGNLSNHKATLYHQHSSSNPLDNSSRQQGRQHLVARHIPAAAAQVVNLSGAGDTLTGAFAAALIRGATAVEALAVGVAAAKASVECELNVPGPADGLVYDDVMQQARQLLERLQTWHFPVSAAL